MSRHLLKTLIKRVQESEFPILTVFDLDSTLFNVSHRSQAILQDTAADPELRARFPEECEALRCIEVESHDWGIRSSLMRHQMPGSEEFFQSLKERWRNLFFSNHYLHSDKPYEGAREFVQALTKAGASIAYLTGRMQTLMEEGTRQSLESWDFPLNTSTQLQLRPASFSSDMEFKRWKLTEWCTSHKEVWFFENEPLIIHNIRHHCPQVNIVFVDSTHSGQANPPEDLPTISLNPTFQWPSYD